MKKGLLFGSLVAAAVVAGFMVNNDGAEHVRDYQPKVAEEAKAFALHQGRFDHYKSLLANSKTGEIEAQDRFDSWEAMQQNRYNETKSLSLSFVERGPDNIGGRTRAIGIDRSNDAIMYAGSVTGGLFKSTDQGNNWSRVQAWDDQIGPLSISSIETTSDGTLYVGTGGDQFEGGITNGGSGTQNGSNGVYYSTDGGDNWTHLSGTSGSVMQIWRDPSQSDRLYIGGTTFQVSPDKATGASVHPDVTGNGYDVKASGDGSLVFIVARVGGTFRFYHSTDYGSTFAQIPSGQLPTSIGRAECAVTDTKNGDGFYNIYVSACTGGGSLNGVYVSEDNGFTFTNIGPGGSTLFTPYSTTLSAQGNYNQTITYVPGKPDECIIGGIDQYHWEKTPGSSPTWGGWSQISLWSAFPTSPTYIHADNHEQKWNSAGQYWYGNDGGVGSSFGTPPSGIFYPANKGYNVTQFYSIAHDKHGAVMAGAQDNGTLYNDYTLSSPLQFQEVQGGDGFDCDISHYDSDAMFATVYNSSISRSEDGGNNWQDVSPPCSGVIGQSCGVFHTPIRLFEDPNDLDSQDYIEYFPTDSTIPSGTELTYYSQSYSATTPENVLSHTTTSDLHYTDSLVAQDTASNGDYFAIHPGTGDTVWMGTESLILNYPYDTLYLQDPVQSIMTTLADGIMITRDALRFGQSPEWWDISSATSFSGTPYCMEFSWDGDIMYVGTFGGVWRFQGLDSVYTATDVSKITATKIYNTSRVVNGIGIDKNNDDRIVIAVAGTGGNGVVELNGARTSGGAISGNNLQGTGIPTSMAVLDVIVDYRDPNKVIAATDFGVWATSDNGSNWTQCINETGPVPVFAIRQQQREWNESDKAGEIYIGTHGRGVWTSGSVLSDGVDHLNFDDERLATDLSVYPNPMSEAGNVSFQLNQRTDVQLNVYSIGGKLIKTIKKANLSTGKHIVDLDMSGSGKGTYIIQLVAGNKKDVTRFIKLK